jgi:hypothetical protein
MKNRLGTYFEHLTEEQKMEIYNVETLKVALETAEGYCVTIHLLNPKNNEDGKGKLEHHLLLQSFPFLDLLKCNKKAKDLMIQELEKDSGLTEF